MLLFLILGFTFWVQDNLVTEWIMTFSAFNYELYLSLISVYSQHCSTDLRKLFSIFTAVRE